MHHPINNTFPLVILCAKYTGCCTNNSLAPPAARLGFSAQQRALVLPAPTKKLGGLSEVAKRQLADEVAGKDVVIVAMIESSLVSTGI